MPRVSAFPGVAGAALAAAVGCWWWPAMLLQEHRAYADLPLLSAQAALVLILGQWLVTALCAGRWFLAGAAGAAAGRAVTLAATAALTTIAPGWPLLALLWLTGTVSGTTLAALQALIALSGAALALLGVALSRSALRPAVAEPLGGAACLAAAAAVWLFRDGLRAWVMA